MTPQQELLAHLQGIRAVIAEGIQALEQRVNNEGKYTAAALAEMDARLAQRIGQAQVMTDALPDYRAYAPQPRPQ